ncbi:MAG TPA: apolipoprotein N-acyltransferase [Terracidiphilus sp.]|nr:apolipoprotein N-acyltransferase [Terracidiphilus sp.]
MPWAAAGLSAGLLELPFPFAGPMPPWRSVFAWVGLVPLLWALLGRIRDEDAFLSQSGRKNKDAASMGRPHPGAQVGRSHPLRRAFFIAYLCGVLWYCGNCYWIRDTMLHYGDMPPLAPELLTLGFSLVLGLYWGLFGLGVVFIQRATKSTRIALAFAPFLWTGLDLAAARITSVPWDQLGYSQIDNALLTPLAPWTGVYGITFVLVAANALLAGALLVRVESRSHFAGRWAWATCGAILFVSGFAGIFVAAPKPNTNATAVLIQPNLDVGAGDNWPGPEWNRHIAEFTHLAGEECKTYIAGIPQTGAPTGEIICPPYPTHPDLVAWPESPAPFIQDDLSFQQAMRSIALGTQAPLVVGGIGADFSREENASHEYNSAFVFDATGQLVGRYDKIHLVPFGEYIPFQNLLTFAHKLTGRVSSFTRGSTHRVFLLANQNQEKHRYGVFICYEAVFADEVRHLALNGAEVLVNISDDGWYGDTSAPWQHLNMARMRAVENRRWLLRDTNNGVTAAIDPYGRVRQSIPRHQVDALPAQFGFRDDVTFYTAHGDVFVWLCAILSIGVVGWLTVQRKSS